MKFPIFCIDSFTTASVIYSFIVQISYEIMKILNYIYFDLNVCINYGRYSAEDHISTSYPSQYWFLIPLWKFSLEGLLH